VVNIRLPPVPAAGRRQLRFCCLFHRWQHLTTLCVSLHNEGGKWLGMKRESASSALAVLRISIEKTEEGCRGRTVHAAARSLLRSLMQYTSQRAASVGNGDRVLEQHSGMLARIPRFQDSRVPGLSPGCGVWCGGGVSRATAPADESSLPTA
jgi:hypothetical protein